MMHDDGYFRINRVAVIGVVLVVVAFAAGFFLQSFLNQTPLLPSNSSLSDADKNFFAVMVGNSVLNYSDAYCEKKGLRSDLLPQVVTVPDANGENRSIQYYLPVCVAA